MKIKLLSCLLAIFLLGNNVICAYAEAADEILLNVEKNAFRGNMDVDTVENSSTPLYGVYYMPDEECELVYDPVCFSLGYEEDISVQRRLSAL